METEKRCAICGTVIASMWDTDWYRYIRLKYCPACAIAVKRSQTAASKRAARRIARKAKREAKEALIRAKAENEQLRQLKRENDQLRRWLDQHPVHDRPP